MTLELHSLGHATWLAVASDTALLFDPVFYDPFEDGAVQSCPQRAVDVSALPKLSAIVLSHRHPDHFDPGSLHRLSRDVPVLIPPDEALRALISGMGFKAVKCVGVYQSQVIGSITLVPTPSTYDGCVEFGFYLICDGATVWNQVDTAVSSEDAVYIVSKFGSPKVHLASYACQNFSFFDRRTTDFPLETYARNLGTVRSLNAQLIIPASAGFAFCAPHDWLNHFLFPVSEDRFIRDAESLLGPGRLAVVNPGDVVTVSRWQDPKVFRRRSSVSRMLEHDRARLRFDSAAQVPPLVDPNSACSSLESLAEFVALVFQRILALHVQSDEELLELARANTRYSLSFVLPNGDSLDRTFEFKDTGVQLSPAASEFEMRCCMATSVALRYAEGRISEFLLRAYRRQFSNVVLIDAEADSFSCRTLAFVDLFKKVL